MCQARGGPIRPAGPALGGHTCQVGGTREPRLPHGTEGSQRPSRLLALAVAILGLGVCTGLAALGLTLTAPDAGTAGTARAPGPPTGAVATGPGHGRPDPTAAPPRLVAHGPLALIADDILLPQEQDPGWSGTNYDVSLCPGRPATYPGLTTAHDLRVIHSLAPDPHRVRLLAVTADEGAAAALVRQLARPFESCRLRGAEAGARAAAPIEGDQWQEGTMLAVSLPGEDGQAGASGYLVVARAGRAVVAQTVVGRSAPGTDGTAIHRDVADELQGFLDTMSEQVCRYRATGCHTPPPPRYGPPPGAALLADGTFQLPDGGVVAADGTLLVPAPAGPAPSAPPDDPGL